MTQPSRLWSLLEAAPPNPPQILDTRDPGVLRNPFRGDAGRARWAIRPVWGVGLAAAVLAIALGAALVKGPGSRVVTVADPAPPVNAPVAIGDESTVVLVHVVGAVRTPGVVEVPANARVIDAIEKAGGISDDASVEGVNLARVVFDGEQIVVPRIGDELPAAGATGGLISISRADSATLQTLPRVGPATAERIIAWRETHGPFRSVDDLLAVSGIGPATLDGFRHLIVP